MSCVRVVPMTAAHADAVLRIFGEGVATGHATFESAVPTWAVRRPSPGPVTAGTVTPAQFVGDLAIDPRSLRPKLTVRAGLSALTADDRQLVLRTKLRRERLPWSMVSGFEPRFPDGESEPSAAGVLFAITPAGGIELPATRRRAAGLRHVHALLEAYRIRALQLANR